MTLYQKLINAGLPIESATEGGAIIGIAGIEMTPEQLVTFADVILLHFKPTGYTAKKQAQQRQNNARSEAILSTQMKSLTPQQAVDYVEQQIANGVTQAQALAAFDNAATFAAAKPILRSMLLGMYATVAILKLMARILIAMRDQLWPDLPDVNNFRG